KQLDRMQLMDRPKGGEKSASFSFDIERQSGNDVLKVRDASIGYDHQALAQHIDFSIFRQDSIALVGPNGVGKSTLLKTIIKKIQLRSEEHTSELQSREK